MQPTCQCDTMCWLSTNFSVSAQAPGLDPFRPDQTTPVPNFFLAGSYTKQA